MSFPLIAVPPVTGFAAGAVDFDGTNDYMTKSGGLTGIGDGKTGLFSVWFNLAGGSGGTFYLFQPSSRGFFNRNSSNKLEIDIRDTGAISRLVLRSNTSYTAAGWHHFAASWDVGNGLGHLYVDGSDDLAAGATITDSTLDYTISNAVVGAQGTSFKWNGGLGEMLFHTGYLDITQAANMQKLRTAAGKPANLGSDGSAVLGVQPLLYLRHTPGAAASDFGTNLGSGGNFTITGALVESATGPSD